MKVLIIGGSKSGKTSYSQDLSSLLNENGKLYYVATMKPYDEEDRIRITNHIKDRENYSFITLEVQKDIEKIINLIKQDDVVLIDSVTALLCNEMFLKEEIKKNCSSKIIDEIIKISHSCKDLILVSDYIFSDSDVYDDITNQFRKELAIIYRKLAKEFDVVIECSYKNMYFHKGRNLIL